MWRSAVLKASLLVVMVLLYVGVPIVSAEGVVVLNWTSPTTAVLYSVDMVNATYGWAAAYGGTIIHWDGSSWSIYTPSPTTSKLESVFMLGASDGWAIGWDGTIIRWTGTEWIPEFPTAMLMPILISLTLVAAILAKIVLKKRGKPSLPSKTQL